MEQFLQMAGVLAALYIAYALTLKKWDYASEAKRTERRTQLKELGLSNTFYFIHAGTLLILNAVSGGHKNHAYFVCTLLAFPPMESRSDGFPPPVRATAFRRGFKADIGRCGYIF